jgi:hypothetical protein
MLINRAITVTALAGGLLSLAASLVYGNALLAVVSAFFFSISLALWKYGYILIPMLTKAAKVIEIRGGYEVAPSRDYIIKKSANGYYATKFLEIVFYESSMDKTANERTGMLESFEKAVAALKYVVKISLMISVLDLPKHVDDIKTRRSTAESKKSKGGLSADEMVRLDREIAKWNRLLDRMTQGERAVELISFVSTTAFGITRDEAVSKVARQAKELTTILSSSLGCDIRELADLDMIRCFEWEHFSPTSSEEIKDEIF